MTEGDYFEKGHLKVGEALILTKPLGTGALLMALAQGKCPAASYEAMIQNMLLSNRLAVPVLKKFGVKAVTDVTGFGLAGHLIEMLKKSYVSAELDSKAISVFPGVEDIMLNQGIRSTLQPGNEKDSLAISGDTKKNPWIFDPQTSGGFLFSVASEKAREVVELLKREGYLHSMVIGRVTTKSEKLIVID